MNAYTVPLAAPGWIALAAAFTVLRCVTALAVLTTLTSMVPGVAARVLRAC